MNISDIVVGNDSTGYNIAMVLIYLLFMIMAFLICIMLSNKMHIFRPKVDKPEKKTDAKGSIGSYEHQE